MFAYEARYYFPQAPVSCDHVRRGEPSEAEKTESYSLHKFSSYLTDSIRELSLYALFIAEEKEEYFLLSFASPWRLTDCLEIEVVINKFFHKGLLNELSGTMQDMTEITLDRLAQLLEKGYGYNGYGREIMKQPDWGQIREFLNGRVNDNFRFDEQISKSTNFSRTEALQRADDLLAAPDVAEEMKRIYAGGIPRVGCRHPVHYFIEANSLEWGRDMADLLINALADNKRLQTRHVSYIHSIANSNSFKERYMRSIISCLAGSSVVIELAQGEKPESNKYWLANDVSFQKFLGEMVKKYGADTLFIFLSVGSAARQVCQPFLKKMEECIDIVQLSEGIRQAASAKKYIGFLEQKTGIEAFSQEELSEFMTADSYTPSALLGIFTKLCRMRRRSKDYPAYHSLKPVTLVEEAERGGSTGYERLQRMAGLTEVKKLTGRIIAMCQMQKLRREQGLEIGKRSLHMVFTGNPGSAKTTVARLLAEILYEKGVTSSRRLVECGRADLVGKYVGWTAKLVKARFAEAKGGVLFIDEAYSLVEEHAAFGQEAINTIVQEMENRREDTIVIMAGYPSKMQDLLAANEGLRSRIAYHVNFPDYNAEELVHILSFMAETHGYLLNQQIQRKCYKLFSRAIRMPDFGNGRYARNQLEDALAHQAERLLKLAEKKTITKRMMRTFSCDDFQPLPVGTGSKKTCEASGIGFRTAVAGDSSMGC